MRDRPFKYPKKGLSSIPRDKTHAKIDAYRVLRLRPRSEHELKTYLLNRGYDEALIGEVFRDLKKMGEIDDKKFAKLWVESRLHSNPRGDMILRHELKDKGIAGDVIDEVIAQKDATYDEYEEVRALALEKYRRLKRIEPRRATKRVYDFLVRKGFKYDTVRKIVDEIRGNIIIEEVDNHEGEPL